MKDNKRILLATGNKVADTKLADRYKELDGYTVVGIASYKDVIEQKCDELQPDILVVIETLEGKKDIDIFKLIKLLRIKHAQTRVIFVATKRNAGDIQLANLVGLAVYDIIAGTNISLKEIADHIENPKSFLEAKKYLPEDNLYTDEDAFEKAEIEEGIEVVEESKEAVIEQVNKEKKTWNIKVPELPNIKFEREEKTQAEKDADEKLKEADKKLREQQRQERIAKKNAEAEEKAKLAEEKRIQREKDAEEHERQRKIDEGNRRIQAEKDAEEKKRKDKELAEKLERDKELARLELEKAEDDANKAKEEEDLKHKRKMEALEAKELKRKAKRERQSVRRIKWRRRKKFVFSILTAILVMALIYYVQVYTGKEAPELISNVFDFAKSFVVDGFEKIKPFLEGILNKAQETLN